jgi:immune inhibitor A
VIESELIVLLLVPRVAVVLVDFSDKVMVTPKQHFEELFFSNGRISTGSVTEYYKEVSGGRVELNGKVVGPFRMPLTLAQYAHGSSGITEAEPNLQTLGAHALAAADGNIDLTPYDNDHNGQVDAFIVVHAGEGAEEIADKVLASGNIWSAKWNLVENTPADNTHVFGFLTVPEFAKIGVCAHEIGHLIFGWPDLYDIDGDNDPENIGVRSSGVGDWCLMGSGSWGRIGRDDPGTTPCHPSAWCKANQGWITVIPDQQNRSITLKDVKKEPREAHRLWTNGNAISQEYFLIENRQQDGFDRSLPGQGLLSK